MFSRRVPGMLRQNRLSFRLDELRASGRFVVDLTASNPTIAGFIYPPDLLAPLAAAQGLVYTPDARGLAAARAAIAADYRRRGHAVDAANLVLFASTSEAYSTLFKVLCDPGDAVVIARPGYPLLDHLAAFDGVRVIDARLDPLANWRLAHESIPSADSGWRALVLVSPGNPTGARLTLDDARLADRCAAAARAAVIIDEVFDDYDLDGDPDPPDRAGAFPREALWLRLGGLSKSVGLPQVKLAWVAIDGPPKIVDECRRHLEFVNDHYLNASTPVQISAPALLRDGAAVRDQIRDRVRGNLAILRDLALAVPGVTVLRAAAGWHAMVRVPATSDDEELALRALDLENVLVHPGFFFDFETPGMFVVSLIPPPDVFRRGVEGLLRMVAQLPG